MRFSMRFGRVRRASSSPVTVVVSRAEQLDMAVPARIDEPAAVVEDCGTVELTGWPEPRPPDDGAA